MLGKRSAANNSNNARAANARNAEVEAKAMRNVLAKMQTDLGTRLLGQHGRHDDHHNDIRDDDNNVIYDHDHDDIHDEARGAADAYQALDDVLVHEAHQDDEHYQNDVLHYARSLEEEKEEEEEERGANDNQEGGGGGGAGDDSNQEVEGEAGDGNNQEGRDGSNQPISDGFNIMTEAENAYLASEKQTYPLDDRVWVFDSRMMTYRHQNSSRSATTMGEFSRALFACFDKHCIENAHVIVSTALKTSALKFHEKIRCLLHLAQSVAESITPSEESLEELKIELAELRKASNPNRKAFLDFLEHCWNQLPDYIDKQDPNRTRWPHETSTNGFFEYFAGVICTQIYGVSPERLIDSQWSLCDLLFLVHPNLPADEATEVKACCEAIALLSPKEMAQTWREKFYNKRRHRNQNAKKQKSARAEKWTQMKQGIANQGANQGASSSNSTGHSANHRAATGLSSSGTNKRDFEESQQSNSVLGGVPFDLDQYS